MGDKVNAIKLMKEQGYLVYQVPTERLLTIAAKRISDNIGYPVLIKAVAVVVAVVCAWFISPLTSKNHWL